MVFDFRQRAALVIAHPGHELSIYGWLERVCPVVFVLTDGSGQSGTSRLDRTATLISQAGASRGGIFGRFTDAAIYSAILETDFQLFYNLVDELSLELRRHEIDYVAGDASEGYNPVHDLWRLMLNTAVRAVQSRSNRKIDNFDFPLTGRPDQTHPLQVGETVRFALDEAEFERKIRAAENYAELGAEIESAVRRNGFLAFRNEYLRPVSQAQEDYLFNDIPFYERYGERQVAAGVYSRVIRYEEHMRPIADALDQYEKKVMVHVL